MLWLFWQLLQLAWKILTLTFIFNVFFTLIKNGRVTVKDLCDTAVGAIRVWTKNLQKWIYVKYKESEEEPKKEP